VKEQICRCSSADAAHQRTLSRVSNLYILYSTLRYELWKLERAQRQR
jgi:hypothetical protein